MTALILGLVAALCTGLAYIPAMAFLTVIGLVLAIAAWIVGHKKVKADRTDTKARIGMIIGIIITVWAIVAVVMTIAMLIGATAILMG
ncbi:MAG: hypothetical protein RR716_01620 [Christensenellaceae bacterium]